MRMFRIVVAPKNQTRRRNAVLRSKLSSATFRYLAFAQVDTDGTSANPAKKIAGRTRNTRMPM